MNCKNKGARKRSWKELQELSIKNLKRCSSCKEVKDKESFGIDKHTHDGLNTKCKFCKRQKEIEWGKKNKEKVKDKNFKRKAKRKSFYDSEDGIKSSRRSHLKRNFDITLEYFEELNKTQSGLCKICNLPETSNRNKVLCVDHDHKTGEIRGLLCNSCNRGLGLFRDDIKLLNNAIKYLENV